MMVEVIKLQSISDTPLQIDSSDINALEAGLEFITEKQL